MSSPAIRRIQDEHKVDLAKYESAAIIQSFSSSVKSADTIQKSWLDLHARLSLISMQCFVAGRVPHQQ